jgi:hypothetical protein
MNHWLAKIAGWTQFGLTALNQLSQAGTPHGWAAWLTTIASGVLAVGVHAAAKTDGTK